MDLVTSERALSAEALEVIAAGLAETAAAFDLPIPWGELRAYTRLLATPAYEAWLIAWLPSSALELHDHGGSAGAVHVVRGSLRETAMDLARPGPRRTTHLGAGDRLAIAPTRVHEVWNPGPGATLSVHVYSPPMASMTFFDPDLVALPG